MGQSPGFFWLVFFFSSLLNRGNRSPFKIFSNFAEFAEIVYSRFSIFFYGSGKSELSATFYSGNSNFLVSCIGKFEAKIKLHVQYDFRAKRV